MILKFGDPLGKHTLNEILDYYNKGAITKHETAIKMLYEIPSEIREELKYLLLLNNEGKGKLVTTFKI